MSSQVSADACASGSSNQPPSVKLARKLKRALGPAAAGTGPRHPAGPQYTPTERSRLRGDRRSPRRPPDSRTLTGLGRTAQARADPGPVAAWHVPAARREIVRGGRREQWHAGGDYPLTAGPSCFDHFPSADWWSQVRHPADRPASSGGSSSASRTFVPLSGTTATRQLYSLVIH